MTSPFHSWLRRLEGKRDAKINIQIGNDFFTYSGTVIVVERDLCLFKERETVYLFRIEDIIEISGEDDLFKCKQIPRKPSKNPFWRWIKALEGRKEDVEIITKIGDESYSYDGKVVRVETDLCLFQTSWKRYLFRIDDVIEINGDEPLFNLRANVEIEEIGSDPAG